LAVFLAAERSQIFSTLRGVAEIHVSRTRAITATLQPARRAT